MPFLMPELVVESILLDGLQEMSNKMHTVDDQIDELFAEFNAPYLAKQYGEKELKKVKQIVTDDTEGCGIRIDHGFNRQDPKFPRVVINTTNSVELEAKAVLDDHYGQTDVEITPETIINSFNCDSYDPATGIITCNTSDPNLANVRYGMVFVDGDGDKYNIIGAISNEAGDKRFAICRKLKNVNLVGCIIERNISIERKEQKGITESERVTLYIQSKEPLTVKYIYQIIKYIVVSRKDDLQARCMGGLVTFEGSDFKNMPNWEQDHIYTRAITLKFSDVRNTWNTENVTLIDSICGDDSRKIWIERDKYPRDCEEDLTVGTIDLLGGDDNC